MPKDLTAKQVCCAAKLLGTLSISKSLEAVATEAEKV
jgi:hypothetical protein